MWLGELKVRLRGTDGDTDTGFVCESVLSPVGVKVKLDVMSVVLERDRVLVGGGESVSDQDSDFVAVTSADGDGDVVRSGVGVFDLVWLWTSVIDKLMVPDGEGEWDTDVVRLLSALCVAVTVCSALKLRD